MYAKQRYFEFGNKPGKKLAWVSSETPSGDSSVPLLKNNGEYAINQTERLQFFGEILRGVISSTKPTGWSLLQWVVRGCCSQTTCRMSPWMHVTSCMILWVLAVLRKGLLIFCFMKWWCWLVSLSIYGATKNTLVQLWLYLKCFKSIKCYWLEQGKWGAASPRARLMLELEADQIENKQTEQTDEQLENAIPAPRTGQFIPSFLRRPILQHRGTANKMYWKNQRGKIELHKEYYGKVNLQPV